MDKFDSIKTDGVNIKIVEISFAEVLSVWEGQLWPNRKSVIEPYSAININGVIDGNIVDLKPSANFLAIYCDNKIAAVTSYHMTSENQYRLRGTWVAEQHRGRGLGKILITKVINEKFKKNDTIWTLSREMNRSFYEKAGFKFFKSVIGYEYGPHCVMILIK